VKRILLVMFAVLVGTALGKVWYVHPDSTQDSIQPCLDACGVGDTVLVAAGTYHERLVWPNTQGIKFWSESGPDSTVLDGDSSGIVITIQVALDTTTAVEGFTIARGFSPEWTGGIMVEYGAPMIRNNTFTGNVGGWGGAIGAGANDSIYIISNRFIANRALVFAGAIDIAGGTAFVIGNLFERNVSDTNVGALAFEMQDGVIQGNVFSGNRARYWYGGLLSYQSDADIIGNTFTDDSAGSGNSALCLWDCGKPVVAGNRVQQCSTRRATAVCCHNSSPRFLADTFANNKATSYYGIIYCEEGSLPHFSRCLIADNSAPVQGAITVVDSSSVTMDSCTVTGNGPAGFFVGTGAGLAITNSNFHGNPGYAVNCEYYAESVYAYNNWWGDSTGPFHPDSNPGGLGDAVSDGVLFRPWLRDSVVFLGLSESDVRAPVRLPTEATIVRGVFVLPEASSRKPQAASLMDIAGRRVVVLRPGANDVRTLAPGVYFVCSKGQRDQGIEGSSVRKVVITR